ncbi:exportin-T [Cryptococcus depauperatus]
MAVSQSPHLTNIPEAVRVAASVDPTVDPALKQQAIDYLTKVRELCEETWQDCLQLYLQGAGASGPSTTGRDGKEKLGTDLRIFCLQVVDTVLTQNTVSTDALQAMYKAIVDFVEAEYIGGFCEGGQTFLRNKLAFTITQLFLQSYPSHIPTFLRPFLALLSSPASSPPDLRPQLLTIRFLLEIAQEIHDTTLKTARVMTKERQDRDGVIRDAVRSNGDDKMAVEAMSCVLEKGLEEVGRGQSPEKWGEAVESTLKTFGAWIPWIDLDVALNPSTLPLYHRLLQQPIFSFRTYTTAIYRILVSKGIQDASSKLQVLRVLDPLGMIEPLESETRGNTNEEAATFRAGLGGVLSAYGVALISISDNIDITEPLRLEAEKMMNEALPLLLRFLSDRHYEVPLSVSPFVSDLLRIYKRIHQSPNPSMKAGQTASPSLGPLQLSSERRQFLASMLDVLIRQLAWPEDTDWEAPGNEDDTDEDIALFKNFRGSCRSFIESIAQIDRSLHTEVVARMVASTLDTYASGGAASVPWQQAELALHLVYTFGEVSKNSTRAAFFDLPPEVATKIARNKLRQTSKIDPMSSGRTTPSSTSDIVDFGVGANKDDKFDYDQYPLSPLGQLLTRCMTSGISAYPHPSVSLQYFEITVRYIEFWRAKPETLPSLFETILDGRGIHNSDQNIRRRCFYLFARLCKDCKSEAIESMVSPILENIRDIMVIDAEHPRAESSEEDPLVKATTGKTYAADQFHLFEASGNLVYLTKSDPSKQMTLLEAIAGPLLSGMADGVERSRARPDDLQAVLQVHHHLMALGHFAKGFPVVPDKQVEVLPYTGPFKQMTKALLHAIEVLKKRRVVRDAARFAFSQFANAIGTPVAELVPRFVSAVITEFESSELVDFLHFLQLLMHRLQGSTFETMDMLLLPLLSRIFAVLQQPVTGTDEAQVHTRLKEGYLAFFTTLMNENLDGIFTSERNKAEFENVLTTLLNLTQDYSDGASQRLAFSFFSRSVIAWGTCPEATTKPSVFAESAMVTQSKMLANGSATTNQNAVSREQRAQRCLPGYGNFIYQRLLPAAFEVPANSQFNIRGGQLVVQEAAVLVRNTVQARGQETIDFLLNDLLPKLQCPPEIANQFINSLTSQQAKDFKKTFMEFIKAMRG